MVENKRRYRTLMAFAVIPAICAILAGCGPQETYPISGEACSPDDPVQTLDAVGCVA